MAGWRRAVELAMTDEEIERLTALSRSRTEPAGRYRGRRCCWPIARILRSVRWGKASGSTIKRFSAAWSGRWAMGRWRPSRIDHGRAKNRSSRRRPKPGWCRWRATRPRSTAIHMSCGRRGFWHVTHASTDRRWGTNVSPSWFKARCARSSASRKSSRTRCATIWNVAMPSSSRRWRRFCVFIARSRF